jgi:hypothetical protein
MQKKELKDKKIILALLEKTKDYNQGQGLLVSPVLADKLKEYGITENYTTTKKLKTSGVKRCSGISLGK